MLNGVSDALVKHAKKKIKKSNIVKITFYIFKILNAQFSRDFFYNNLLN
jgi:hypothetical protein